ncbi:hypothetical protein OHB00_37445 [Streptomyces sp. NBC_00631]|uniref:hypothetical protein n=1 Tax=Streptomyces sp. NBC_00631 TaxID=2975793 RepID=UPI0030E363BB
MSQGIVSGLSGSCARAAALSGSGRPLKALKFHRPQPLLQGLGRVAELRDVLPRRARPGPPAQNVRK